MEGDKADEARKKISKAANKALRATNPKKAADSPGVEPREEVVDAPPQADGV